MPILNLVQQGRFGNSVLQYLFCRALAERYRFELHCDPWIGEKVFDIPARPYTGPALPRMNELEIEELMARGVSCEFRGYAQTMARSQCGQAQMAECMIYTKRQAQAWLKIRPELLATLEPVREHKFRNDSIVAHHRKGDYIGYSYPVVSRLSYQQAAMLYFGFGRQVEFVSEEEPTRTAVLPEDLPFVADFYRLLVAPTLMRANSTFSFLAGLLGNGLVLSPRIDGLEGGREHDGVKFEAGNHCKLSDLSFCSDLHVAP